MLQFSFKINVYIFVHNHDICLREVVQQEESVSYNSLEQFMATLREQLNEFIKNPKKLELFENPVYVIQLAHGYGLRANPEMSEFFLSHAFDMDRVLGFQALYFRALTWIEMGHKLFLSKKKRQDKNNEYHRRAKDDLILAYQIAESIISYMESVVRFFIRDPTCALVEQFNNKISLLLTFQHMCERALSVIKELETNPNKYKKCVVKFESPINLDQGYKEYREYEEKQKKKKESEARNEKNGQDRKRKTDGKSEAVKEANEMGKKEKFDVSKIVIPKDEIKELEFAGLRYFYQLGIAEPPPSKWVVFYLAVAGALQICTGFLLSAVPNLAAAAIRRLVISY